MPRYRNFDAYRRERSRRALPFSFELGGRSYSFEVKPSFALMETFSALEEEVAHRTSGDPDLTNPDNRVWVFRKVGEVLALLIGATQWDSLRRDLQAEEAIELVAWVGDELAAERERQHAEEPEEDEEEATQEIGPTDVPPEGKQGEDLPSPRPTF